MPGLSNIYLEKLSKKLNLGYFMGVFSSDSLPNVNKSRSFSLICNFSKQKDPGTHLIAILCRNKNVFYFDSYGLPCYNPLILKFLKKLKKIVYYNSKTIQARDSIYCGYYALACCTAFENDNIQNFLNIFTHRPTNKNENICIKYLINMFKQAK